jgi:hypothetical protein
MIWAAVPWWYPISTLNGRIIAPDYDDILGNQVNPMVQMLFPNNAIFQDDNSPIHTATKVQSWCEKHEDALQHLSWPAQLPDLNIIETLWSVLDSRVRSRFPPPTILMQVEDTRPEVRYNIPLETVQNLHKSISRRTPTLLQANVGSTPC